MRLRTRLLKTIAALALLLQTLPAVPYSIQSHEELIDLAWKQTIQPLILRQYPGLTEAQFRVARSYAYGGSAIQDIGYYPFGNRFFSDLTHYVRSGDFVLSLLHNAGTPNELAFAIGSLAHYVGDTIGHGSAVNLSVPVEFPRLEQRYGRSVNYAEDPHAHVQTEFAFDINQLSKLRFAPSAYLRAVGLEIPSRLLNQAFFETYGLNLRDIIGGHHVSLRTYRFAARRFIPDIARAETILHKKNFPTDTPGPELGQLAAELSQAATENDWARYRQTPGILSHIFAGFIYILPKVGTLKLLAIKGPTTSTEDLYVHSVSRSIAALRLTLTHFDDIQSYLPNRDLDTGLPVAPGSYPLTDGTYASLLARLVKDPNRPIPAQLKHDIIAYYADPQAPISTKKNHSAWAKVQANLVTLNTMSTTGDLNPPPTT